MPHLKYYEEENAAFPEFSKARFLTNDALRYYFDRLKSHYKFRQYLDIWNQERESGNCNATRIRLAAGCPISYLAHEAGHAIQYKERERKYGRYAVPKGLRWHNKRLRTITNRILRYIETNKAAWDTQIAKNAARHKEMTIIKAQKEQQMTIMKASPECRLIKLRGQIKSWESKRRRAENALKKLRRREKLWVKKAEGLTRGSQTPRLPLES